MAQKKARSYLRIFKYSSQTPFPQFWPKLWQIFGWQILCLLKLDEMNKCTTCIVSLLHCLKYKNNNCRFVLLCIHDSRPTNQGPSRWLGSHRDPGWGFTPSQHVHDDDRTTWQWQVTGLYPISHKATCSCCSRNGPTTTRDTSKCNDIR